MRKRKPIKTHWACVLAICGLFVLLTGCLERPLAPRLEYDAEEVQKLREEISELEI